MESARSESIIAAYKDVLRAIVSLAPPPLVVHEKLLATIFPRVMFVVAITVLWFGAWRYPFTLVSMVVGAALIMVALVTARAQGGKR